MGGDHRYRGVAVAVAGHRRAPRCLAMREHGGVEPRRVLVDRNGIVIGGVHTFQVRARRRDQPVNGVLARLLLCWSTGGNDVNGNTLGRGCVDQGRILATSGDCNRGAQVYGCGESLEGESVQAVSFDKLSHGRSKESKAHQANLVREFEQCGRSPCLHDRRRGSEGSGECTSDGFGPNGVAEPVVPEPRGEDRAATSEGTKRRRPAPEKPIEQQAIVEQQRTHERRRVESCLCRGAILTSVCEIGVIDGGDRPLVAAPADGLTQGPPGGVNSAGDKK